MTATSDPFAFDPTARVLSGACGRIALDVGPALITGRLMAVSGRMVPRSDLVAALGLPASVGDAADSVLRGHLRTVRVLVAALSGGKWTLRMQGQDAAGLFGPPRPKVAHHVRQANRTADVVSMAAPRPDI